ncbi:hypothetical protein IC229_34985 [Spirosoma sp. BT702]|uniref:Dystroglycan-type cadherin-like domain-containing protein n=1 Tax=Spirosoma profusum TaxID=2771354 RepID=A0A927AWW7_9BACT|nr:putative Ig domain-containing protein [Spirosoma profusum]MBD2705856.1 hypothetical protein [Spirosoma profusum]
MNTQRSLPFGRLLSTFICLLSSLLFITSAQAKWPARANGTIVTVTVTEASICPGGKLSYKFTTQGTFKNVQFSILLSDNQGNFSAGKDFRLLETLTANEPKEGIIKLPYDVELGTKYVIRIDAEDPYVVNSKISAPFSIITPIGKPIVQGTSFCNFQPINVQLPANCSSDNQMHQFELSDETGKFPGQKMGGYFFKTGLIPFPNPFGLKAGTYKLRVVTTINGSIKSYLSEPSDPFTIENLSFAGAPTLTGIPACPEGSIEINFSATCNGADLLSGQINYQVILSDASGNFANAQLIAQLTKPGTASVKLPPGLSGNQYRVKIKGMGNGVDIESPASIPFSISGEVGGNFTSVTLKEAQYCSGSTALVEIGVGCPFPEGTLALVYVSDATGSYTTSQPQPLFVELQNNKFNAPVLLAQLDTNYQVFNLLPDGNQYRIKIEAIASNGTFATIESPTFTISQAACASQPLQVTPQQLSNFTTQTAAPSATQSVTIQQANPNSSFTYSFSVPDAYEISFNGVAYSSGPINVEPPLSKFITQFPLLIRLKKGLMPGTYLGTLSIVIGLGTGESSFIPLSGVVTDDNSGGSNLAPIYNGSFTSQTVKHNTVVNIPLPAKAFTDPEGQALTWSATGLPDGLSLTGQAITGTAPAFLGLDLSYNVTITATDPGGLSTSGSFQLTVSSAGVSQEPLISVLPSSLSGFSTTPAAPSDTKVLTITKINTFDTFELGFQLPTGYEASFNVNGPYYDEDDAPFINWTALDISTKQLYVRLKSGLLPGNYLGTIGVNTKVFGVIKEVLAPVSGVVTSGPVGGSLQLLAPDYNCQSGAFTFKTSGGDGSPIEFMAIGITGWTTNPAQFVDTELRTAADAKPLLLRARQKNVAGVWEETSLTWDIRAQCPVGNNPPEPGGSLQLVAPTYNCQSGAFTFQTTGGNGSAIEFKAIGITDWTTTPNQYVDAELRTAADAKPILLWARQSGKIITYLWDIRAQCPISNNPPDPNGGTLQLVAPAYNCLSGAFTFQTTGGNGSAIEFRAIGVSDWTTNPNQYVDTELRTAADAAPILLRARQSGVEVTYTWDIRAQCPVAGARLAARESADYLNKLDVVVLGNPLTKDEIEMEIRGAEGQSLSLMVVNAQGYLIAEQKVERAQANERQTINVRQQASGVLLLRVSSMHSSKTVRIIKP